MKVNFRKFILILLVAGIVFSGVVVTKSTKEAQAQTRPSLCSSTIVSKTSIGLGESVTITSTANTTVNKFMFAFFNADNLNPGPQLISYSGSQYTPTVELNATQTSKTFSFAELARPDSSWGGKIPQNIQVNGYFFDAQNNQSAANPACSVRFSLAGVPSTPPTARMEGTSFPVRVGETKTFTATLTGTARSGSIWIARGADGKSDFTCPAQGGLITDQGGEKWCKVAEGTGPTISGNFTFLERGNYTVTIDANVNENFQYTPSAALQCTGNPFPYGDSERAAGRWSDCGSNDNITINSVADPVYCTLVADKPATVERGQKVTFTAYASKLEGDNDPRVKRVVIAYTYPALPAQQSSDTVKWNFLGGMDTVACRPGQNCQATLDTSVIPAGASNATVVCNAFMRDIDNPFLVPTYIESRCTGHPWAVAANATVDKPWYSTPSTGNPGGGVDWSSCGQNSYKTITLTAAAPTPPSCTETGNLDGQGGVDDNDFEAWKREFISPGATATDCDKNNKVDLIDFNYWRNFKLGLGGLR